MGKIIGFYSYVKNSGKTTIAFNIANILANRKSKVAIIELDYYCQYLKYLKISNSKFDTQNLSKKFINHNLNNGLTIISLNKTLDDSDEWLHNEINKWKNNYDYLLIEFPWLQNNLWNICLKNTDKLICILNAQNFASDILLRHLTSLNRFKQINKNLNFDIVLLNKYIDNDATSMTALVQMGRVFKDKNQLKTLQFDNNLIEINELSLNYAIKEFWSKYAIELNEIVKLL